MTRHSILAALLCAAVILSTTNAQAEAGETLPPVQRVALDNGLQLLLIPNKANPYVDLRFLVKAGSASDPSGKEGLAQLMAEMLTNGTSLRSEDDIATTLDNIGARLYATALDGGLYLGGSAVTLDKDNLRVFLDVFLDCLRNATFPQASFDKTKTRKLASLKRAADDNSRLASRAFFEAVYGEGTRGRTTTIKSMAAIERQDLVDFHRRVVIPQHAILAIAGDFDGDAMASWAQAHLGQSDWGEGSCVPGSRPATCERLCDQGGQCLDNPFASKAGYRDAPAETPPDEERLVILVDKDDPALNQVHWRLGADAPVHELAEGWAAFKLGTQILGGDFTARLNTVLRVKEGLTYGARFPVAFGGHDSGPMRVSTYVAPKDLKKAIDLSIGEINALREAPLKKEEIVSFQNKLTNAFPFRFETVSDALGQYVMLAFEDIPVSWLAGYNTALRAVSAEEVHRAMQAVDPNAMTLVAVGNRDLLPVLSQYGRVKIISAPALIADGLSAATWVDDTSGEEAKSQQANPKSQREVGGGAR